MAQQELQQHPGVVGLRVAGPVEQRDPRVAPGQLQQRFDGGIVLQFGLVLCPEIREPFLQMGERGRSGGDGAS